MLRFRGFRPVAGLGGTAVAALLAAAPAAAQTVQQELDLLRSQVEMLMQRIDTLEGQLQTEREVTRQAAVEAARETAAETVQETVTEAAAVTNDRENVRLEISGRINQALLYASNGEADDFFIVDNDNSGSRIGFRGEADIDSWTTGAYLEVGFEVNTTDEIDFDDEDGPVGTEGGVEDFLDVRHAEWYVEHPDYGEFFLGFGDTATESVSEIDLSGTGVIMESDVDDTAGGLDFENGVEIDSVFSNLDGERTSRILYRTPSFYGFQAAVAGRQEDGIVPDLSVTYGGEFAEWEFAGGIGYRREEDVGDGADVVHGSASVLAPFGTNLTFAAGNSFADGDTDDAVFVYGKLGQRLDLIDLGETRFAVDVFYGEPDDDSETFSVGAGVVQVISDLSTDVYLGVRNYSLELDSGSDPDDLIAVMTGARVRF